MNKKLIIAIAAGVAALALIITAAVIVIKKVNLNEPEDNNSSLSSSASSDTDSTASSGSSETPTVQKGSVSIGSYDAKTGDTVDVPIKLSENPGVFAGQFIFEYDADNLEYVDYEEGDLFDEYEVNATSGTVNCVITASTLEDVTKDGTVIVLQFKVKDGASKGDYSIKLSDDSMICNLDEAVVTPKIADGKITVE